MANDFNLRITDLLVPKPRYTHEHKHIENLGLVKWDLRIKEGNKMFLRRSNPGLIHVGKTILDL